MRVLVERYFGNAERTPEQECSSDVVEKAREGYTLLSHAAIPRARGAPYRHDPRDAGAARSERFDEPVLLPAGAWRLPAGAFAGDSCGPT